MKQLTFLDRALWAILVLAICGVTFYYFWKNYSPEVEGLHFPVSNFSFTNQYGNTISKKDLEGNIIIADFIFTNCAGQCPMMTTKMLELSTMFKYENDVRFLSISVDPNNDSPEILKKYASGYGISTSGEDSLKWIFLTGEKKKIFDLVKNDFKLPLIDSSGSADEIITHSAKFVLLNDKTEIMSYYDSDDAEKMKELYLFVRKMLNVKK